MTGKDFDDSIPRIRATEEGRPDGVEGIQDHHSARRIAQEIYDKLLAVLKEAEEEER